MTGGAAPVLIEDGHVLTLDSYSTHGRLSIAVADGSIAAVGERGDLRDRFPAARRISARDRIVLPGLINAHLHPDLHVLKGALEDRGLHDWRDADTFNAALALLGTPEGAAFQRAGIRASLAEAALSGTTCAITYGVTDGAPARCAAALVELGMRGAVTVRDASFQPVAAPAGRGGEACPVFYRLHAEETLYAPELEAAARAHAAGARIVMHAAETAERARIVRERFGIGTIALLHRYGLLSPRVLLSHVIHVDAEDIGMIARSGTKVVLSPAAEMKLGDGTVALPALLAAGVDVALGTDAAVCNNGTDMFLEMRALGHAQKLRWGPSSIGSDRILRMATRGGAAILGDVRLGRIEQGAAADLVLVDTRSPRLQPLLTDGPHANVAANLVFAATGADVTDVIVAGEPIVRNRRLRTLNAAALWRDVGRAGRALLELVRTG